MGEKAKGDNSSQSGVIISNPVAIACNQMEHSTAQHHRGTSCHLKNKVHEGRGDFLHSQISSMNYVLRQKESDFTASDWESCIRDGFSSAPDEKHCSNAAILMTARATETNDVQNSR